MFADIFIPKKNESLEIEKFLSDFNPGFQKNNQEGLHFLLTANFWIPVITKSVAEQIEPQH